MAGNGCIDEGEATAIVLQCAGVSGLDLNTKLGDVFPDDVSRKGFCGCVFDAAYAQDPKITSGQIPCSPDTTFAQVIDSISC